MSDNKINQTLWADGGSRVTLEIESKGPLAASAYAYIVAVIRAMDELASHLSSLADPDPPF